MKLCRCTPSNTILRALFIYELPYLEEINGYVSDSIYVGKPTFSSNYFPQILRIKSPKFHWAEFVWYLVILKWSINEQNSSDFLLSSNAFDVPK